jgi:hypothetical protein
MRSDASRAQVVLLCAGGIGAHLLKDVARHPFFWKL